VTEEIDAALEQIRSESEARAAAAAAAAEAEENRVAALNAAKAACAEQCGPIGERLAETTDPAERAALIDLEARTHAAHAEDLARAYAVFSDQREGDSNPATPGETTQITSTTDAVATATA
jgi:hypothetical protein